MNDGLEIPPIRFAYADQTRLAYQVFGSGPNVVAIPPMAQHIEMAWEWPDIRSMLEQFASFCTYLHFDKRGTGASDRRSRVPGIDDRVEDLRAVMDDASVEKAHFFACSEGGPMAILFAATYPERVEGLIFHGSFAAGAPIDADSDYIEQRIVAHEAYARLWGTDESPVVAGFAPSLAHDPEYVEWHRRYERSAADRDSLLDLLQLTLEIDVREVLPSLDVPTLVIHRRDDRPVPVALGRELAEQIPGARMIELEGSDHFQYAGDVDTWMDEVERFVAGSVSQRAGSQQPSQSVEIVTLGRFAVLRDGEEVPVSEWGSRLARQILNRLVAARRWPVTREELFELCWPDETDMRRLGARLSVQLSAVRRVLGGGIIADRTSVRLDLDSVSTDLERFFDASTDEEVVGLFAGEFLPEDRCDDWPTRMRDETRSRFARAAHRLAERPDVDTDRVAWMARRLIEADRYDERAHRLLVKTLLAAGERRGAVRAHRSWTENMVQIGVEVEVLEALEPA